MAHIANLGSRNSCSKILILIIYYYVFAHTFGYLGILRVGAMDVNVIVDDDSDGDSTTSIEYGGANVVWHNSDQACIECSAQPSRDNVFNGTWHDATSFNSSSVATIAIRFFGTGLSIHCIISNVLGGTADRAANYAFTMDGVPSGPNFVHTPGSTDAYQYNITVYSIEGLSNSSHVFELTAPLLDGFPKTLVLFDYLTYTQSFPDSNTLNTSNTDGQSNTPPSTSASPIPTGHSDLGAIVGGAIGGAAALLIVLFLVRYILRRRRREDIREVKVENPVPLLQGTPMGQASPTFSSGFGNLNSSESSRVIPYSFMAASSATESSRPSGRSQSTELHQRISDLEKLVDSLSASTGGNVAMASTKTNNNVQEQITHLQNEIERLQSSIHEGERRRLVEMTPPEYTS